MLVRAATQADIPVMMQLAAGSGSAAQWTLAQYQIILEPSSSIARHAQIAEQEGYAVGFAVSRQAGAEWEIENIVVENAFRRQGIGEELLRAVLALAREHGASRIFLEVRASNSAAHALYEKLGFISSGRRRNYYQSPQEDALLFEFSFPSP